MKPGSLYNLELFIAKLLRIGVLIAGVFLLIGWMSQFQFIGNPLEKFEHYQHIPFAQSFRECWEQQRWGLITAYVGLCILISLPIIRVFMTAVLFYRLKEFLMASAATLVFVALLLSFSLGFEI